jgi:hypothetical protein
MADGRIGEADVIEDEIECDSPPDVVADSAIPDDLTAVRDLILDSDV